MKIFGKGLLVASAVLMMVACSNSKNDSASPSTSTDTLTNSPSSILGAADKALGSLGNNFSSSSLIQNLAAEVVSSDSRCSENGRPWDPTLSSGAGDRMNDSNAAFAPTMFYCMLSANIGSPDTLRGAMQQFKSVFCSIEAVVGTITYTTAGNDLINSATTIPLTSACWPQGLPDGMSSVTMTDLVATQLNSSTDGWQYKLVFDIQGLGVKTIYFFLDSANGKYGFKTVDPAANNGKGGATAITMDTKNGVLLMNNIDDRDGGGGANSSYRRLTRARVTGTFDASTNRFTAIDKVEGYHMESNNTFSAAATDNSVYGVTVMGNASAGYKYAVADWNTTNGVNNRTPICLGGACTGVNALELVNGDFYNQTTTWGSFITSGKPLCDDGNSVTLNPTPATGALGVCAN